METKESLCEWMKRHLKCAEYEEIGTHGHLLLEISKKTWYNYRMGKTKRIPADIAAKLNKELISRGHEPFEF